MLRTLLAHDDPVLLDQYLCVDGVPAYGTDTPGQLVENVVGVALGLYGQQLTPVPRRIVAAARPYPATLASVMIDSEVRMHYLGWLPYYSVHRGKDLAGLFGHIIDLSCLID